MSDKSFAEEYDVFANHGYGSEVVPAPEVVTDAPQVWVIASGEYDDAGPIAVVSGSEEDARRYVDRYNAQYPDLMTAYVWREVDYIAPPVQD